MRTNGSRRSVFDSENGGLIVTIAGIVAVYGIDRITKNTYRVEAKKDSFVMEPVPKQKQDDAPSEKPAQKRLPTKAKTV